MNVFEPIKKLLFLCLLSGFAHAQGLEKKYLNNETYGYEDLMEAYGQLAEKSEHVNMFGLMNTDSGEDLPVVILSKDQDMRMPFVRKDTSKLCILVLNGIHSGESNGVDASLHWVEQIVANPDVLDHVTIYIIPVYNIGGYQNQSCCTRANQEGPKLMGFRGNANNLDLNRDFIKCDANNTKAFQMLFQGIKPDLLIDTHSTNGADYQYVMTLLPGPLERFSLTNQTVLRNWFNEVNIENNKHVKTGPYVNVWGKTPEPGFVAYRQTANLSGGYTALFGVPAITLEAHMFKSYQERVEACLISLNTITKKAVEHKEVFKSITWKKQGNDNTYPTSWKVDSSRYTEMDFLGYEAESYISKLTRQPTYRYNREKPKTTPINIYDYWVPGEVVEKPRFYFLHAGQHQVVELLQQNGVMIERLQKDTLISCSVNYVSNVKSNTSPYEGHFNHLEFDLESHSVTELFHAGDWMIDVSTQPYQYVFEVLEPQCEGSFFRWNFLDSYLQQKEWFSTYIFEEKAIVFLEENPEIKAELIKKRAEDEAFAKNHFAQLYWIYRKSPYYEKEHMRIPLFRVY